MKAILLRLVLAAGLVAGVAGCRNVGYNDQSLNNSLTPNVSQTQVTRTWQPTPGQPGR
jgi:ABC-type phosphate/phosphonate transport system substrate-binding protein